MKDSAISCIARRYLFFVLALLISFSALELVLHDHEAEEHGSACMFCGGLSEMELGDAVSHPDLFLLSSAADTPPRLSSRSPRTAQNLRFPIRAPPSPTK